MDSHLKALLALLVAIVAISAGTLVYAMTRTDGHQPLTIDQQVLATFRSRAEMSLFFEKSLDAASQGYPYLGWHSGDPLLSDGSLKYEMGAPSHSETNIQVAGVDEADIVKTDGIYAYIASSDRVSIVAAYPPEDLRNVSLIDADDILEGETQDVNFGVSGLFIADGRLVVISWAGGWYNPLDVKVMDFSLLSRPEGIRTIVSVFDVTHPSTPRLEESFSISGHYVGSRLIGDYLYVISQSYVWGPSGQETLPKYWVAGSENSFEPVRIGYDPDTKDANSFLNMLSVRLTTGGFDYMSIVAGSSSMIYMSQSALYLTFQKWEMESTTSPSGSVTQWRSTTTTSIYKVTVDGLRMSASARGDVSGWLLNQFSMDEEAPYLRVAATNPGNVTMNNVYILDDELRTVGALEGLAPSENIYAARFVGDTLYLITFRQVDPLFVIDLADATAPRVVGELSMPGFSSYLHPVDQDHVLGIGSESDKLKIALYNVSDPANPTEQSKCLTESSSWSAALSDHKAILFDLQKHLLVIPVTSYDSTLGYSTYTGGAYVFDISLTGGISLRGVIQHQAPSVWRDAGIQRSLYIEDHLYTISYSMLKVNRLSDLQEENSLIYYVDDPQNYPVLLRGD